jgi:dockerin type I repeat protein
MRSINTWIILLGLLLVNSVRASAPPGFVKTMIPLNAPPVGLAFDPSGTLYALEQPAFGSNEAELRVINHDGSFGGTYPVLGNDPSNFFVGGMTYDPLGDRLLVTDNTADGELYAVSKQGVRQTIATGLAGVADVAVRSSGEIFVTTSPFGSSGAVLQIDRTTGTASTPLASLGFGGGLAFDKNNNLIAQDADTSTFAGRLQQLPTALSGGTLTIGPPQTLLTGMQSSAGVVAIGSDLYTTGVGGLYRVSGTPLSETLFDTKGTTSQFATALAFNSGSQPFTAFAGLDGGQLAYMADFGFGSQDSFITLLRPAEPGDYNGDGRVDASDYAVWRSAFGTGDLSADGNSDGAVNAADYVIWRAHTAIPGYGAAASHVVPEPSTMWIVFAWIISVGSAHLRWRR